ncbi:MAG: glycosyltransferase N-terminal domain-containing protein [Rhodobacter sp.]|nr:glycosyltransferase N-terminal domain-containing protein [Rhodobacter sp.]
MGNSLSLALYLATRGRRDRASRRALGETGEAGKTQRNERLGQATESRPDGPLIWVHSGQDRHALSVRELAFRLRQERPELQFLLTTSASRRKASEPGLTAQFAPDEHRGAIRRFLDLWHPDLAVWTEPDLRPALIAAAGDRQIPLFLIDAHTARPDLHTWRWFKGVSGSLLQRFERVLTGDADTAAELKRLGAEPRTMEIHGFLEEGTPPLPCNEADRSVIASELAGRPVWLAAGIGPAELDAVLTAHRDAQRRSHRLLLIISPRDPATGPDLLKTARSRGFGASLRTDGAEPDADVQVYIADTEGELGLWYRIAPIAFLGQSLGGSGGINPFEAAALGAAIVHGPNVRLFRRAFGRLAAAGATRLVRNTKELAAAVEMLQSPDIAAKMAHEAWRVCSTGAEVTDRAMDLILTTLDEREAA